MIKADIESVIREREKLVTVLLEKCRYAAFLLHNPNVARPLLQLKILRNLQERGFREVYILTHDDLTAFWLAYSPPPAPGAGMGGLLLHRLVRGYSG
jgi:hypothetical protein